MSGILERIEAKLDQLLSSGGSVAGVAGAQQLVQQPTPAQTGLGLLGGGVTPAYPPATQEQIVALITPLVENPNIKAVLQQQMAAMGIAALPDATPAQYPELYHRFQQVAAQVAAAQAAGQQQQAPASII